MAKNRRLNKRTITNSRSSRQNFNLRKTYLNYTVPNDKYNNFFDTSLTPCYGKVDTQGNIVYPSESYLVPLYRNTDSSADTVYAMNFVADAFTDLQNYFNKANQIGILTQTNDNVQTINPVKGWQSVHTIYSTHIKALYRSLISSYFEQPTEKNGLEHARPHNFEQYLKSIGTLYNTKGSKFPLTRSSYILSNRCPQHISGLVIEVTPTIDYSDDAAKNFTYIESSNFKFYMHALKKYGFMADREYPGRIIADLGSPVMQEYMSKHLSDEYTDDISLDNLFDLLYYKAKDYDYDLIKNYLVQFYNNYASQYPVMSETTGQGHLLANKYFLDERQLSLRQDPIVYPFRGSGCGFSTTTLVERYPVSESDLETKYNQDFWLPIYAKFLNYELKNPLNDYQLEKTIKNAKDLKKNIDFDTAIGYIGDKFNFYRYPATDLSLANYEKTTATTGNSSTSNGGY